MAWDLAPTPRKPEGAGRGSETLARRVTREAREREAGLRRRREAARPRRLRPFDPPGGHGEGMEPPPRPGRPKEVTHESP